PEFSRLEPLDVISWTSERNGYASKLFEVAEVAVEPFSLATTVAVREKNPADYDWAPADELPTVPVSTTRRTFPSQPLPRFDAVPNATYDD
ncbi:hypothetical protein, partial [Escherichia coli]|uniref:hypothetical protein n=1 Tax=Escherichia coli TaxID=562 RepID=UPI001ADDAB69